MNIYISIPISGKNIKLQMRKARMWQRLFEADGHTVINPFDIGYRLERMHERANTPPPTWDEYMFQDIVAMTRCEAIMLCHGWKQSRGCTLEYKEASKLGLKIKTEAIESRKL